MKESPITIKRKSNWNIPEMEVRFTPSPKTKLSDTSIQAEFLRSIWDQDTIEIQESIYCVFLDTSRRVISWRCVGIGTCDTCVVDLKFIVQLAVKCNAYYVIMSHNHPGGDPRPSEEDDAVTSNLTKALNLFNIILDDHIILTSSMNYSYDLMGKLPNFDSQHKRMVV